MTQTIRLNRKDFIARLASVKDDNIAIADVVINRSKLLEVLRLQNQEDLLTLTYGKVSWEDYTERSGKIEVDNETCVQFSCNHAVMRFLNRPKQVRYGQGPKIKYLNFIDHTEPKPELMGIPLDTQELLKALSFVLPCVATEQSRPVLNCVLLDCGDDAIKLVAADGYRLGIATIPANGIPQVKLLIHPAELLTFLKSIKPVGKGKHKYYPEVYIEYKQGTNAQIEGEVGKVKFAYIGGGIELDQPLGTFPDYTQLIPKDGTHIQLIPSQVLEAIKALNTIAKDGSGIIRLQFSKYPDKLTLSAKAGYEENESQVECLALVDKPCHIAANSKYLFDLLRLCGDNAIDLFISHYSSPMVCHNGQEQLQVIMPMFVQW